MSQARRVIAPIRITCERAEEIRASIMASHGWRNCATEEERDAIVHYWHTLPSSTSFHGAVSRMANGDHET